MLKICCHCKKELSVEEFQKNRSALDGLQYRCKACTKIASKTCRTNRGHLWLQKISPWKKRNRDAANASTRARRARDPEKIRKQNRQHREKNPYNIAVIVARNRASKFGVKSTLTQNEWKGVVQSHDFLCHICGREVSLEIGSPEKLSLDHILPMSRGGENVKENVAPSHRRCNQNRTDMTISEFDNWIKDVLEFRSSKYGCT